MSTPLFSLRVESPTSRNNVPGGPASSQLKNGRSHRCVQNRSARCSSTASSRAKSLSARSVPSAICDAVSEEDWFVRAIVSGEYGCR